MLYLSLLPTILGSLSHLAPDRRPWGFLAVGVARLGLLHVMPRWCCVRDAEGARCAFCARLVGFIRTPPRWRPLYAAGFDA